MEWKTTRIIRHNRVRQMCINLDLYTKGDNSKYEHMLYVLCSRIDADIEHYEKIAQDILDHSDWQKVAEKYGEDYNGLMELLLSELINECSYIIVEREVD